MTRGYDLYVDVLAALKRRPRTAARLHAALGRPVGLLPLRRLLGRLADTEVLRIAGYAPGKGIERIYGIADDRPSVGHRSGRMDAPVRPMAHVTKFAAIWRELDEPTTVIDLVESCGTSRGVGRKLMQRMVDAGLVGVSYVRDCNRTVLYQRGAAVEPRPPRQNGSERWARQKQTRKGRTLHQIFTFSAAPPPARLGR